MTSKCKSSICVLGRVEIAIWYLGKSAYQAAAADRVSSQGKIGPTVLERYFPGDGYQDWWEIYHSVLVNASHNPLWMDCFMARGVLLDNYHGRVLLHWYIHTTRDNQDVQKLGLSCKSDPFPKDTFWFLFEITDTVCKVNVQTFISVFFALSFLVVWDIYAFKVFVLFFQVSIITKNKETTNIRNCQPIFTYTKYSSFI